MNWYRQSQTNLYLDAVKSGNTSAAQELVNRAAQAAGFNVIAFHSTNDMGFTVFRTGGLSAHFGTPQAAEDRGKELTDFSKQIGRKVKPHRLLGVYLSLHNPLRLPDMASVAEPTGRTMNDMRSEMSDEELATFEEKGTYKGEEVHPRSWEGDEDVQLTLLEMGMIDIDQFEDFRHHDKVALVDFLKSEGYDGIVYKNDVEGGGGDSYIVFDPNQIKSAETVTYDNGGNIIPLSERFNTGNPDTRW